MKGLKQSTLIEAAQKGYQTVLSAGYYIDQNVICRTSLYCRSHRRMLN